MQYNKHVLCQCIFLFHTLDRHISLVPDLNKVRSTLSTTGTLKKNVINILSSLSPLHFHATHADLCLLYTALPKKRK